MLTCLTLQAADLGEAGSWLAKQGGTISVDRASQAASVSLRYSWITDGDLARLTSIPAIRHLDLSYTHVTDNGLEHLKRLPGVVDLDLGFAEFITDEGLVHLKGWTALERLSLRGTKITDTGLEHLSGLLD